MKGIALIPLPVILLATCGAGCSVNATYDTPSTVTKSQVARHVMQDIDGRSWGKCSDVTLATDGPYRYTGKATFASGATVNLIARVDGQNVSYRVLDAFSPSDRPATTSKPNTIRWSDVLGGIILILILIGLVGVLIEHPGILLGILFLDWLMRRDDRSR